MGFLHIAGLGKVHFHEYGTGTKPMLAFHGYGMTGKQFHVLEKSVLPKYHIYGFDHFFHDKSTLAGWSEKQILAGMPKEMVKSYVEEWFKIYGLQRFSVMGYSIGANLALILVEEYAGLIDNIVLMAPDGLSVYKGFHFLMHNTFGRYFFNRITKSKWMFETMLKGLLKVGFIDQSLYQIAYSEMDTPKKRSDVYYTLNLIRLLKPDSEKVIAFINHYKIPVTLIFGRQDNLFPKKAALPFIQRLNSPKVHEVKMGHWLITPALDDYLAKFEL